MATKMIAPRPGEGVEELTVVTWLKNEGDDVAEMESVVEVETDKVVTEIPSPAAGKLLKIYVPAGDVVKVGDPLALIGAEGEEDSADAEPAQQNAQAAEAPAGDDAKTLTEPKTDPDADAVAAATETPQAEETGIDPTHSAQQAASQAQSQDAQQGDLGFISPLVRKIAEERKIDLSKVKGSGKGGRITKADLEAYIEQPAPETKPEKTASPEKQVPEKAGPAAAREGEFIPHTPWRRQIAERMVNSVHTSPQVLTVMEADLSKVLAHRKAHKADYERQGVNLTLTAYFIKAIADALAANPRVNAAWEDDGLRLFPSINIGMAVALGEGGLIVPVIRDAQTLSLLGIAEAVNDLATRARGKKLQPAEVRDGTFTITNHGTGGSLFAMPIINQPQLAILGVGKMEKRAVVVTDADGNDSIAIRPMVYLSLVFDHRALDGESADIFLAKIKEVLEGNWN